VNILTYTHVVLALVLDENISWITQYVTVATTVIIDILLRITVFHNYFQDKPT